MTEQLKPEERAAKDYRQMWEALQRIKRYQSPERMRRASQKDWGVGFEECLEMAYENMQIEAVNGLSGVRKPRPFPPKIAASRLSEKGESRG